MCHTRDNYHTEDIVLHEFSHGVHLLGAVFAIRDFDARLRQAYNNARARGLWYNTYAMSTDREYLVSVCILASVCVVSMIMFVTMINTLLNGVGVTDGRVVRAGISVT